MSSPGPLQGTEAMAMEVEQYVSIEAPVITQLCPKCQILRFRNLSEVSSVHDLKPTWTHIYEQPGEPFRPVWRRDIDVGIPYFLPVHDSFEELERSAKNGCHICLQMHFSFSPNDLAKFKSVDGEGTSRKVWLEYRESRSPGPSGWLLKKDLYLTYDQTYKILKLLPPGCPLRYGSSQIRRSDIRSLADDNWHTGSKTNLEFALKWMEDCFKNHRAVCGSVSTTPKLPKRVIDVSGPPVLHVSHGELAAYAILSHCWGKNKLKPIRTTMENLKERCTSIPWELFPKTYQDAIETTRALKLKYLWIDSLCIIQKSLPGPDAESSKDWLEESLKMGDHYGNAIVCIGAAYATDDTIGCFVKRNPLSTFPCNIQIQLPNWKKPELYTSWLSDVSSPTDHWSLPHKRRPVADAPLNRRAWVLQESTMSTRMLNFEAEQVTWECHAGEANELCPDGHAFPGTYTYISTMRNVIARARAAKARPEISHFVGSESIGLGYPLRNFQPITQDIKEGDRAWEDIWTAWRDTLQDLTQREIYTGWDLLPAVSGIATTIQQILDLPEERYLAGIWDIDLPTSLLWATQVRRPGPGDQQSTRRPRRNGRSPTWSWASLDNGNIDFTHHGTGPEELSDAFTMIHPPKIVPLAGSTRFGQISEGRLYLSGYVRRARVGGKDMRTATDDKPDWIFNRSYLNLEDPETREPIGYFAADEVDKPVQEIWCIPLKTFRFRPHRDKAAGLALVPTGDQDSDFGYPKYRRLGIVNYLPRSWFASWRKENLVII